MSEQLRLGQIAYSSEWALTKFFEALRNEEIARKFVLRLIGGVESSEKEAGGILLEGIIQKAELMRRHKNFRNGQFQAIIENSGKLLRCMHNGNIRYISVNGNNSLPEEVYSELDALVIHSINTSHLGYIEDAIKNGTHVICEKPLVPILRDDGSPTEEYLKRLRTVTLDSGLVLMNAEHYSFKQPSCYLYDKLNDLIGKRKIKSIEGKLLEIDDPDLPRTRDVLSLKNQTGLMGDTMCHLAAFVSNLGGKLIPVDREFANYNGFDVDTYDHVRYTIEDNGNGVFGRDAEADLTIGKFIDKFATPMEEEAKYISFTLDDNSEISLDFRKGELRMGDFVIANGANPFHSNEYVNSLNQFYDAVRLGKLPTTNFRDSLNTIESTLLAYMLSGSRNRGVEIYNGKR